MPRPHPGRAMIFVVPSRIGNNKVLVSSLRPATTWTTHACRDCWDSALVQRCFLGLDRRLQAVAPVRIRSGSIRALISGFIDLYGVLIRTLLAVWQQIGNTALSKRRRSAHIEGVRTSSSWSPKRWRRVERHQVADLWPIICCINLTLAPDGDAARAAVWRSFCE